MYSIVISYLFNYKYLATCKVLVRSVVIHVITSSQDGRVVKALDSRANLSGGAGSNPAPGIILKTKSKREAK